MTYTNMVVLIRRLADCQLGDDFRIVGHPRRGSHVGGADVAGSAALLLHFSQYLLTCPAACLVGVGQGGDLHQPSRRRRLGRRRGLRGQYRHRRIWGLVRGWVGWDGSGCGG